MFILTFRAARRHRGAKGLATESECQRDTIVQHGARLHIGRDVTEARCAFLDIHAINKRSVSPRRELNVADQRAFVPGRTAAARQASVGPGESQLLGDGHSLGVGAGRHLSGCCPRMPYLLPPGWWHRLRARWHRRPPYGRRHVIDDVDRILDAKGPAGKARKANGRGSDNDAHHEVAIVVQQGQLAELRHTGGLKFKRSSPPVKSVMVLVLSSASKRTSSLPVSPASPKGLPRAGRISPSVVHLPSRGEKNRACDWVHRVPPRSPVD